jgi:hypothetical protein
VVVPVFNGRTLRFARPVDYDVKLIDLVACRLNLHG